MLKTGVKKHLRKIRWQLFKNFVSTCRGWLSWRWLIHKYRKDDIAYSAIILMPNANDHTSNYLALRYLDQMLDSRGFSKALILTSSNEVVETAGMFSKKIISVVKYSRKKAERLMLFYSLYAFDKRFILASLDEPFGRNASRMIGQKGITAEELFVIGVYKVYPYKKMKPPAYDGVNTGARGFLAVGSSELLPAGREAR